MKFLWKDLKIEHVEQTSGVFTGSNHQSGWMSVKKTNQGIGQPASSLLINTQTYIDDCDGTDFVHIAQKSRSVNREPYTSEEKVMSTPVILKWQELDIGAMHQQSVLAVGENYQPDWEVFNKSNNGIGVLTGFNITEAAITFIDDRDFMDHVEIKTDSR